jgi:DNA-binding CsgD family transcriptional regulator
MVRVARVAALAELILGSALPRAAVFIADPAAKHAVDQRLLREAYGLSHSEAAVATLLSDGLPLAAIAARLGLTVETVRTYAKRVYAKTGVSSQTALVALVLRSRS